MRYWSEIAVDLLVAVVEMLFAWSVLYYVFTFNSDYGLPFIVFSVMTVVLWVGLLAKDLSDMYEHLGDNHA